MTVTDVGLAIMAVPLLIAFVGVGAGAVYLFLSALIDVVRGPDRGAAAVVAITLWLLIGLYVVAVGAILR